MGDGERGTYALRENIAAEAEDSDKDVVDSLLALSVQKEQKRLLVDRRH